MTFAPLDKSARQLLERVRSVARSQRFASWLSQHRLPDAPLAVDELVAVAAAVAEEVAVDLAVVAVADAAQRAVALARDGVAAEAAVHADRRRRLQIPLARVVLLQRLVGEDAGRADLDQVAAELALQHAVLVRGRSRRGRAARRRRNRGRRRSRGRSARSGSTGCSGSSRG